MCDKNWRDLPDKSGKVFNNPLKFSEEDLREYRLVRFNNQLEVFMISDPHTKYASAAMNFGVGQYSEPENIKGLAHLFEHQLFARSEDNATDNEFYLFMSNHGGNANAETHGDHIIFDFHVVPDSLKEGLEQFFSMLSKPPVHEERIRSEIAMVDSELEGSRDDDYDRITQIQQAESDPSHPSHSVFNGSTESLAITPKKLGLDVTAAVKKFHKDYFSANILKLCVLGKEPLDQLQEWVTDMFSAIPNNNVSVHVPESHPWTSKELSTVIVIETLGERSLELAFQIPDQWKHSDIAPIKYLDQFISSGHHGSFFKHILVQGWTEDKIELADFSLCRNASFYNVVIQLTPKGLVEYEQIVVAFFEYVEALKMEEIPQWYFDQTKALLQSVFDEESQSMQTEKRQGELDEIQSCAKYVRRLVEEMQYCENPEWIVSARRVLLKNDPQCVRKYLDSLCLDKCRLTLTAPKPEVKLGAGMKTCAVFGTKYEVKPISASVKKRCKELVSNKFCFPPKRNFTLASPERPTGLKSDGPSKPHLALETPVVRLWYKENDMFISAKSVVKVYFKNPICSESPSNNNCAKHYARLLTTEVLKLEDCDPRTTCTFYSVRNGIVLSLEGYSEHVAHFLPQAVRLMQDLAEGVLKPGINISTIGNSQYSARKQLTRTKFYAAMMKQVKTCTISVKELEAFMRAFMESLHIESLVLGTLDEKRVIGMFESVEKNISPMPLKSTLINARSPAYTLPEKSAYVFTVEHPNPNALESSIEYYCQAGDTNDVHLAAPAWLVSQFASEKYFETICTKENLGYYSQWQSETLNAFCGFRCAAEAICNPAILENRIENFFSEFRTFMTNMSEEEYELIKQNKLYTLTAKLNDVGEESEEHWRDILVCDYSFNKADAYKTLLETMDKNALLEFMGKYLNPLSPDFRKFSVHVVSKKALVFEAVSKALLDKKLVTDKDPLASANEVKTVMEQDLLSDLTIPEVLQKFVTNVLGEKEGVATLVKDLEQAIETYDYSSQLRKENELLDRLDTIWQLHLAQAAPVSTEHFKFK